MILTRSAEKLLRLALAALLSGLALVATAGAQQVDIARDLLNANLFPPDVILREADQLGLSDTQRDALTNIVRTTKTTMGEAQAHIREAGNKLRDSLLSDSASEAQLLDQLGAMLDAEKEMKRGQFTMLLGARRLLTAEQASKLREIVRNQPQKGGPSIAAQEKDARQELDARMQKVQQGVDRWRSEGRDPAPIVELMKTFSEQMQAGKLSDAKDTLNRALDRLKQAPSH